MEKKPRMANIELLRSIAMMMVITLHYLDKGKVLIPLGQEQSLIGLCAWMLEAFAIVAVNVYVLISGYFLVETGFSWKRLVMLVAQVLFYSLLIPVVLGLTGVIQFSELNVYDLLYYVFPLQMNHYWFATAYILLYLFIPVLSLGVKQMKKEQLRLMIGLLLLAFSVSKTFLPFQFEIDARGYDVIWFICLFCIAAYIRRFGTEKITNSKKGFLLYGVGSAAVFLIANFISFLSNKTGKFEYFSSYSFHYNYLFCLLASIGLFLGFLHWNMPEGKAADLARKIAPYTFGVYLIHENINLRYLWPEWLQTERWKDTVWLPLHLIASVLLVFLIGISIDYFRSRLFNLFGKKVKSKV